MPDFDSSAARYRMAAHHTRCAFTDVARALATLAGHTWAGRLEHVRDELRQIAAGLERDAQADGNAARMPDTPLENP